jgi:hypothetical protein
MSESLPIIPSAVESQLNRDAAFRELREMVLNSVVSKHSKRNYAKALDEVYALCEERKQPLSRALLMKYRAVMLEKKLSASTVNVRLSGSQADRRGAAQRNHRRRRGRKSRRRPQPLPEGNQGRELAHARPGQRAINGP